MYPFIVIPLSPHFSGLPIRMSRGTVKSLVEVQVYYVHRIPPKTSYPVKKGNHAGLARFVLGESMLAANPPGICKLNVLYIASQVWKSG